MQKIQRLGPIAWRLFLMQKIQRLVPIAWRLFLMQKIQRLGPIAWKCIQYVEAPKPGRDRALLKCQ